VPVLLQNRQRGVAVSRSWLGRTAEAVLAAAGAGAAELSLVLVSDRRMRALNRRYRKKDRPTDVLAFPQLERHSAKTSWLRKPQALPGGMSRTLPMLLGDVVIAMPTAKRQAKDLGHDIREEVTRLLVHGVLHLLGYDHERSERDAQRMAQRENMILRRVR